MLHPSFLEQEIRLVGHRWSPRVHELKRFLHRSGIRFRWFDLDLENDQEGRRVIAGVAGKSTSDPIVLLPDGSVLVGPDVQTLAARLRARGEPVP